VEHVPGDVFGEDYLYFYQGFLTDELSDRQTERIWSLLGLETLEVRRMLVVATR
jgi:hypothetical protein